MGVSSFSVVSSPREKESTCPRVNNTCSGCAPARRLRFARLRRKSAISRNKPTKIRTPRAMPTLAPVESPDFEVEGEVTGDAAVGVVVGGRVRVDVGVREVVVKEAVIVVEGEREDVIGDVKEASVAKVDMAIMLVVVELIVICSPAPGAPGGPRLCMLRGGGGRPNTADEMIGVGSADSPAADVTLAALGTPAILDVRVPPMLNPTSSGPDVRLKTLL